MVCSGKTKSFEYSSNKSANDQSVSHNINKLKNIRLKMSIILLLLKLT